jgi:hypothetical protein
MIVGDYVCSAIKKSDYNFHPLIRPNAVKLLRISLLWILVIVF